jgi:heptosyltransferase-2
VTPVFGIGNSVLLSGLLLNLRRLCPRARITLAVPNAEQVRIVLGPALADEIVAFDGRSPRRALAAAWRLRGARFDLGLATFFLPRRFATAFLALAGCRHRVAHGVAPGAGILAAAERGGHEIDRHLQLLEFTGQTLVRAARVEPTAEASAWARDEIARWHAAGVTDVVGVHPGCEPVNRQKRWPAARFGLLVQALLAREGTGVLVFLGPGETDLVEALALPESPRVRVVRDQPLARVLALVGQCRVFVSNDSGLMHVAAALGVPVAAIFGPTPVEKNAPVGRAIVVEEPGIWCRPCWQGPPLTCHRDRRHCLDDLPVERVLSAVASLWEPAPAARGAAEAGR